MTAVIPSQIPNHPRHRLTSPSNKDSPPVSGSSGRFNATKFNFHHEQHHPASPPRSLEHHPSKKISRKRQQHQPRLPFSWEQISVLVFLGSTIAVMLTVLVHTAAIFSGVLPEPSNGTLVRDAMQLIPSRSIAVKHQYNRHHTSSISPGTPWNSSVNLVVQRKKERHRFASQIIKENNPKPKVVWLMSFPNSGTSFIIHMTREATNCTTATNYGLEGEIRDKPSVQAIQGPDGVNGPWLEILPSKETLIADTILTKTHCKGFCSGSYCGADKTFHTTRSFMIGCLTGNQGVLTSKGLRLTDKTYDQSLVKKAIHIFRHPLDNVVARFHLEHNEKRDAGNTKYTANFPKDSTGFRRWCGLDDQNKGLIRSRFVDNRLREFMVQIPCFNEFYRYAQWHNLAFETTRMMDIPMMVLHYHEFSENFGKARGRIVDFLELPLIGEGIEFDDGKVYRHYYTEDEKIAVRNFLREFSSKETWRELKEYDYGSDPTLDAIAAI